MKLKKYLCVLLAACLLAQPLAAFALEEDGTAAVLMKENFEDKSGSIDKTSPQVGSGTWSGQSAGGSSEVVEFEGGKSLYFGAVNAALTTSYPLPEQSAYIITMRVYDQFVTGSTTNFTIDLAADHFIGFDLNIDKKTTWRCRIGKDASSNRDVHYYGTQTAIERAAGWHVLRFVVSGGTFISFLDNERTDFEGNIDQLSFHQRSGWFNPAVGQIPNAIYVDDIKMEAYRSPEISNAVLVQDGQALTLTVDEVYLSDDLPLTYNVAWYADGRLIYGASGTTYTYRSSDIGKRIKAVIYGMNENGISSNTLSAELVVVDTATPCFYEATTRTEDSITIQKTGNPQYEGDFRTFAALYRGSQLLLAQMELQKTAAIQIAIPEEKDGLVLKVFTWNDSCKPLTEPYVVTNFAAADIEISVVNAGTVKATAKDELAYGAYAAGDVVQITSNTSYVYVQLSAAVPETLLYLPDGKFSFAIPSGDDAKTFADSAFTAASNTITARAATEKELQTRRNLAFNTLDWHHPTEVNDPDAVEGTLPGFSAAVEDDLISAYPHAYGNRITRNQAMFYAKNALDGQNYKNGHGLYPATSWGGGQHDDLEFVLYFGREVSVDEVKLALRSDFNVSAGLEHDTWWDGMILEFSDGSTQAIRPVKTGDFQSFTFSPRNTSYVRLKNMHRYVSDTSSMWAALNEIEVWGTEAQKTQPKVTTDVYSAKDIQAVMEKANTYYQSIYPLGSNPFGEDEDGWSSAVYNSGNIQAFMYTNNPAFYEFAYEYGKKYDWLVNKGNNTVNGDFYAVSQTYIDLFNLLPNTYKLTDVLRNADYNTAGTTIPSYSWVDLLYMSLPVYSELSNITGNQRYNDASFEAYMNTRDIMFSEEDNLWYRDSRFVWGNGDAASTSPNGKKVFWSRGNGWAFAALAKTLSTLNQNHPSYEQYLADFRATAAGLAAVQRSDGFWNSNLADPDNYGGIETSGTVSFIYGYAFGIRNGLLDYDTYFPVLKKAYDAVVSQAISTEGRLLYVQPGGDRPYRYSDEEQAKNNTAPYAVGLFMLGSTELMQLCEDYEAPVLTIPADDYLTEEDAPAEDTIEDGYYTGEVSVTFSAEQNGPSEYNLAEYLFDHHWEDQQGVRWAAEGYPNWVTANFGKSLDISQLILVTRDRRAYHYKIEASLDGQNFDVIVDNLNNATSEAFYRHTFSTPVQAQYIRLTVEGCTGYTGPWVSINELLIYAE